MKKIILLFVFFTISFFKLYWLYPFYASKSTQVRIKFYPWEFRASRGCEIRLLFKASFFHFLTGVQLATCSFGQKNPLCSSTKGIGFINFGCVRKIGGDSLMETLIYNGRSEIDWKNYKTSLNRYIWIFSRKVLFINYCINLTQQWQEV